VDIMRDVNEVADQKMTALQPFGICFVRSHAE
jgi:hypothetical protein